MRRLIQTIITVAVLAGAVPTAARAEIPWKSPRVTIQAVQQRTVADLIQELASKQGLQVIVSPQVKAVASGDFQSVPTSTLLDTLCDVGNCTWFYDGGKLYVDAADEVLTRTLVVNALTKKALEEALQSVGFASGPLGRESVVKGADRPGLLLLAGGPRYLQATELVARELDQQLALRADASASEYVVRTYRLKYATAQDSTVGSGSGSSVRIPGVASTLQALMNPQGGPSVNGPVYTERQRSRDSLRGSGLASYGQAAGAGAASTPRALTNLPSPNPGGGAAPSQPIIVVDGRLNAIVVRDLGAKMAMYDELIEMLDVPTNAIEITAAIVDVDATDGKDFGVEFLGSYTHKDGNIYRFGFEADRSQFDGGEAPPQTQPSFLDGSNLVRGGGLNVAGLIGGEGFDLLARLRALQTKGGADIVSSPSVLTMENVEAVIRTEETFYVRVAGEQEVDLFDVTAGVQFRVTPSVVAENGERSFRLYVDITDGNFQDTSVDNVPGTRESAITTQAMVPESKTLLLGGYFIERKTSNTRQVPFLGDIPLVGNAFKRKETLNERKQRFFFITPKLVDVKQQSTPAVRDDVHPSAIRAREIANEAWKATIPNPGMLDPVLRPEGSDAPSLPLPVSGGQATAVEPGPPPAPEPVRLPRIKINPK